MTKADFVNKLAREQLITKVQAEATIGEVLALIGRELQEGQEVGWPGFGTFKVVERAAHAGTNPQTKAKMQIPATKVVKFVAAKGLRDAIKG